MTRIRRDPKKPVLNFIYLLMVFTLVRIFAVGMSLHLDLWSQLGMTFLIAFTVRFLVIHPLYLYGLGFLSIVGFLIMSRVDPAFYEILSDSFYNLANNIINNLSGAENIEADNRIILWVLLVTIISVFSSIVIFRNRNKLLLPVLYMPIFTIYWYSFYDHALILMPFFIFSYLLLAGYDSLLSNVSESTTKGNEIMHLYPVWINIVIVYSLVMVFLAAAFPATTDYIGWPWLNEKVSTAFPIIKELRSSETGRRSVGNAKTFDFTKTGYQSDSTRLGGPVEIDDTVIFTIRGDRVNYLRGNTTHHYTGKGWVTYPKVYSSAGDKEDFSKISSQEKDLFYREVNYSLKHENIATTTLFSPYIPSEIDTDNDGSYLVSNDFDIVYPDGIYNGESYYVKAYVPRSFGIQVDRGIDNQVDDYSDIEVFLSLPDETLSQRTIQLTDEIADNLESPLQKAIAIESYLRNNFSYNLQVPHIPEDSDFIDYFLFQGKEGYCTYFATAMTVMLRLEGIPARYVEGFAVEPQTGNRTYQVRNRNAHTWVEAFIEPVGWMLFEPTPAYPVQARLLDYTPDTSENAQEQPPQGVSRDPESISGRDDESGDGASDIPGSLGYNSNESDSLAQFAFWSIIVITLILALKLSHGIYRERNKNLQYANWDNKKKLMALYEDISEIIKKLGYGMIQGETHYEHAGRIFHKFHDFDRFGFKQATDIFVKTKYGYHIPAPSDIDLMEAYRIKLDKQLKNHLGFAVYYFRKIIGLLSYR